MKEPSIQPLLSAGPEQLAAYASALQQMLVVHTVKAKHEELIRQTLSGNATLLPRLFHPDFICVGTQGNITTAKEEMENLTNSRLKLESNTVEKYDVYPFGSQMAIAVGVARTKGTYDGKDISGTYKFFQLWVVSSPSLNGDAEDMALAASVNAEA